MKLNIRKKLMLGFGVVLILMLLLGGFSYFALMNSSQSVDDITANHEQVEMFDQSEIDHLEWQNELADSIIAGQNFEGELDHTQCGFGEWYYDFRNSGAYEQASPEFRKTFEALEEPHRLLHASAAEIDEILGSRGEDENTRTEQALAVYRNETQPHIAEVQGLLGELDTILAEENALLMEGVAAQERTMITSIITILVISLAFVIVTLGILTRGIATPLQEITKVAEQIADGDFTVETHNNSQDEVGQLAQAFNKMSESLRGLISTAVEMSIGVNSGSEQVSSSSEEMNTSLEEASASSNQFAANAQNLSSSAQKMAEASSAISARAEEGNQVIEEVDQSSKDIGKILSVITDIADQTNLLALNAAIEAARAGEQGRGFAVVAEEVRKLAEQSSSATSEIEEMIKSTQESVNKTGTTFSSIMQAVQEISQQVEETTGAAEELSAGSEEMSASIQEQSATMESIASTAVELNNSADQLYQELQKVKYQPDSAAEYAGEKQKGIITDLTNRKERKTNDKSGSEDQGEHASVSNL